MFVFAKFLRSELGFWVAVGLLGASLGGCANKSSPDNPYGHVRVQKSSHSPDATTQLDFDDGTSQAK